MVINEQVVSSGRIPSASEFMTGWRRQLQKK
jgi:hypothetical protein